MRKTVNQIFAIFILLICTLLSACAVMPIESTPELMTEESIAISPTYSSQQDTTKTLEYSLFALTVGNPSDTTVFAAQTEECEFWDSQKTQLFQDITAPQSKTVHFNGASYTGSYQGSTITPPCTYQTDDYYGEDSMFSINSTTGELTSIILTNIEAGEKTLEECGQIAYDFASQFADISNYQITTDPGRSFHHFQFTRYIGNIKTADTFVVGISTAGKPIHFSSMMLGAFSEESFIHSTNTANSIELLCSEQATLVLDNKLQAIYGSNKEKYPDSTFSYEIKNASLVPLPDNTLGTLYTVEASVYYPCEDGVDVEGTLLKILVKCEPSSGHEVS